MHNMKTRIPWFTHWHGLLGLCLYLMLPILHAQESLEELLALKENNAVQLVLQLMDQQQAEPQTHIDNWIAWERERLQIYTQMADWPSLIARTDTFPDNVTSDFLIWAKTLRARAFLASQQSSASRQILQSLIWLSPSLTEEQNQQWLPQWRRQVIETYLEQGLLEDAYTAEQRYRQDYGLLSDEDRLLRARILLLNNHIEEAAELLGKHTKDPQAGMLYLIAQLRGGEREPKKVLQSALRQLRGKWVNKRLQHRLWAVVAEAARRSGDRMALVNALEHLVALVEPQQLPGGLFTDMGADGLWHAYVEVALQLANEQKLLIGDDQSWLKYAITLDPVDALKQRALLAFILIKGQQAEIVEQAAVQFVIKTEKITAHESLLKSLFLKSRYFINISDVSASIRHELVDIALQQSDIPLASRIMATMDKPPAGIDPFMWQLRRARILVKGGNIDTGYEALQTLLSEHPALSPKAQDRFLQVVFDMQSLKAHDEAVSLFEKMIHISKDQKLQRELYFWMADSRKAQENYTEAARWYLKSAMLPDPKTMDPWAQAARYHAASALAKAGLVEDARKMFEHLLRVTEDKNRVAVLERELQQLKLTTQ